MLKNTRIDPSTKYRFPWIEGYSSNNRRERARTSSSSSAPIRGPFSLSMCIAGASTAGPPVDPKRLRDCQWEPCATLKILSDCPSGVYLGRFTGEREGLQSYLIFIVLSRTDAPMPPPADCVAQRYFSPWSTVSITPSRCSSTCRLPSSVG